MLNSSKKIKNIVTIGGGTGSFVVLSGLKKYKNLNLTAVVSMADNGGSTGILRDEYGVLPPGDIRQCLVALSEADKPMRDLFNFRFSKGGFKGHNFGNIFISTLEQIGGDFNKALKIIGDILKVRGRVLPVTLDSVKLIAELNNGKRLVGENNLTSYQLVSKFGVKKIFFSTRVRPNPDVLRAIKEADLIVVGPGNFYSSIIPNFLVSGVSKAVKKSKAKKVFVCNLMNKFGHTDEFSAYDFINEFDRLIDKNIFDFIIVNSKMPPASLLKKYIDEGKPVEVNQNKTFLDAKIIRSNLLSDILFVPSSADSLGSQRTLIRHDPDKLAKAILSIK